MVGGVERDRGDVSDCLARRDVGTYTQTKTNCAFFETLLEDRVAVPGLCVEEQLTCLQPNEMR